MPENITAARYGDRAGDFIRSASILCVKRHVGWLPSAGLLLGFACELLAKRRLLQEGISNDVLYNTPYGHDISSMWRDKTTLFSEAEDLVAHLKLNPNPNGFTETFDWKMHFDQLAKSHSREGDYSLRYHNGEKSFADPIAETVVLRNIRMADQEKSRDQSS